jgi:hypothetical protein
MLAKQFCCGFPASLGEQIAQLLKRLSHNDRNSLLQVESAPGNGCMANSQMGLNPSFRWMAKSIT